jgi:hypothetical protein
MTIAGPMAEQMVRKAADIVTGEPKAGESR